MHPIFNKVCVCARVCACVGKRLEDYRQNFNGSLVIAGWKDGGFKFSSLFNIFQIFNNKNELLWKSEKYNKYGEKF